MFPVWYDECCVDPLMSARSVQAEELEWWKCRQKQHDGREAETKRKC